MDGDGIETRFSDIIPNELMVNILIRLGVKSLKRLCCVNKSWYNLIHSSYFISKHFSYHSSYNVKLLVKRVDAHICTGKDVLSFLSESECGDYNDNDITTPFSNYHNHNEVGSRIAIIGPCINGILCLEISTTGLSLHDVALWNLSTREYIRLPKFHFSNPSIWEPCIEGLGFGWVSEKNEYKVIIAIEFWENTFSAEYSSSPPIPYPGVQVYIYTQTTNSWNQLSFETPFESDSLRSTPPFNSQIYNNGACYWVNQTADNMYHIFSFHMRDEIFGTLPLPDDFETTLNPYGCPTLSILDGCIALILTVQQTESTTICIDVWVMMDDESWIKKFKIGPLYNIDSMVGFVKDDFFLEDESGQLLSINSKSHQLKNLGIRGDQYSFQVLEYVESLFPIKRRM